MNTKDSLLILSGGMDSTTMLYEYKDRIAVALSFDYGSKHNAKEVECAAWHCKQLGVKHIIIPLSFMQQYFKSSLLIGGEDIPEGSYDDENMNNLAKCYYLLNADLIGRELLFRTIHFKLWNKFLLNKGLSLDMINDFSKASDDLKTIEEIGTTINKEAAMRNYKDSNSKGK